MKKIYLLSVLAFTFIVIAGTSAFAINSMNRSYSYGVNDDIDWALTVKILTGSSEPRAARVIPTVPVQIYQNYLRLKIVLSNNGTVTIKIKNNKGRIVCQRQFTADNSNRELEISTMDWDNGKYNLTITNSAGIDFATSSFNVN